MNLVVVDFRNVGEGWVEGDDDLTTGKIGIVGNDFKDLNVMTVGGRTGTGSVIDDVHFFSVGLGFIYFGYYIITFGWQI